MSKEIDGAGRHRDEASEARDENALLRVETAEDRDRAATLRDRVAEDRDDEADERDVGDLPQALKELVASAESDRAESAADRDDAADDRARSNADRSESTEDRGHAALDRLAASIDRAQGALEGLRDTQHLAAVVDWAEDAIVSKDAAGTILTWNRSAERLYGYTAGEAVGQSGSMLLPADRPDEVADIFARFERGERVERFDTKRVRKDGSLFDVSLTVSPIRGVSGDVVGATTIAQDIGERKVAESRLHQLAAIVEASQDAMFSRTIEGRTLTWNAAAEQLFGYSAEEMIGEPLIFLGEEGERSAGIAERRLRADHGERLPSFETEMQRKDGSHVAVSVGTSPITGASGDVTGVAVVVRDLTEQRRLEELLRQSQKLEAIGSLAAGVAHDFNNVLTVIMAASEAILNGLDEGPLRTSASQIDQAATHAASLTRQLLAFGRQQVLVAQPTDLNDLVDETLVLVRRLLSAEILIERTYGAALPSILIDRGQLEQIILNLAINAGDAMPDGGTLTVCTSTVVLDESSTADDLEEPAGPSVLLQLTDTGTGMSPETCERIFDPFFTTKVTGTGLGLATVYGIVKQSGGHIDVYSELGAGTTFKIYLPPIDAPAAALPAVTPLEGSLRGDETILVVEDFDALRGLAVQILAGSGYTVLAAADGTEALAIFTAHPGTVDLLLTDVVMPRMGGRELSEKLRAMNPDLKVLFTSGYPNDTVLRHGIGEAAVGFIQKPYRNEELLARLRSALASTS
jgi:PAS domain S-box-containing protein